MNNTWKAIVRCLLVLLVAASALSAESVPRERLLLDADWKFHLGNEWGIAQNLAKAGTGSGPASASFSDAGWRTINLPHDWAIELPFDPAADGAHGFKALGRSFPQNSVAWYRRTFELPKADAGRRLRLEFDGAYRDCTVFLNGWFVGHHESGYSSFRFDVTDVANCGGKNVLAVKVDASDFEGWFYEGAGLYRHVWLVKTAPLAIAPDGVFVRSYFKNNIPEGFGGFARILVNARVRNSGTEEMATVVRCEIYDPAGQVVGKIEQAAPAQMEDSSTVGRIKPGAQRDIFLTTDVQRPELWSPETPRLYRLITTVASGTNVVDRQETEFGIRTVAFDASKGFLLNGKPYVLKGTCNHQDHAGVGAALPDRLQYFRVAKLKEMGCNAYRTSHNAPTPELLEACDRLGMLVMDENRLLGSDAMNLDRLERQILRDRNHASVVIWSIANEEFSVQSTVAGRQVAATMQDFIRRLDPTRPITYPAPQGNDRWGINEIIEVRGWNYHVGKDMDDYHRAHPHQPSVGTEQGSTVSTRGIYANDPQRGYVSAYDDNAPNWAHTAETWWSYFDARPWLAGGFVWTGFDYRGEPTPYQWPCINSHFGILDTCGFPKDNFWYYQSWWTDKPVLHLLPHWNWPGREGREIDVRALSNCEEVELFLNGRSLGKQTMTKNSELKWKVKYAPGALTAKGFRAGQTVAETKVETTGEPAAVVLTPDRAAIDADGQDLSIITVAVRDAVGRVVPTASNRIEFALAGPGRILGVGNGDPSCHEPDVFVTPSRIRLVAVEDWRWRRIENPYDTNLVELSAGFDDANWQKHNVRSETGPMGERQHGIFRANFVVSPEDLAADAVELTFGMIDEDGFVFVNGRKAGESHDWQVAPVFDVKGYLHPGTNVVAIAVANYNGWGGVNKGVNLRISQSAAEPKWQRSVFNGLAQIIVQSRRAPGEIQLTAHSAGLQSATLTIRSHPAPLR